MKKINKILSLFTTVCMCFQTPFMPIFAEGEHLRVLSVSATTNEFNSLGGLLEEYLNNIAENATDSEIDELRIFAHRLPSIFPGLQDGVSFEIPRRESYHQLVDHAFVLIKRRRARPNSTMKILTDEYNLTLLVPFVKYLEDALDYLKANA